MFNIDLRINDNFNISPVSEEEIKENDFKNLERTIALRDQILKERESEIKNKIDSLNEAIEIMHKKAFSQVLVIQGTQILGTASESSIISKSMGKDIFTLTVSDVMVEALPILPPGSSSEEIFALLKYHPAILVVSKGMLLGIITKADIMHHLLEKKVI